VPNAGAKTLESLFQLKQGADLGRSDWFTVTQDDIVAFARLTRDEDEYHVNPEWAREHSSLGTTISFGFLTMSMLTHFLHQAFAGLGLDLGKETQMFNFGFNRLRLPEPVPAGAKIRGSFSFEGARTRAAGGLELTVGVVVEIEGNDRPALVADWLFVAAGTSG
jgi:acyl dehydratase